MVAVTSKDVLAALYYHLTPPYRNKRSWPGPPGAFCVEIQAPRTVVIGPRGGRRTLPKSRADAVYLPKIVGTKPQQIITYEVKVTRADLKSELDRPEKSLPWRQYSNQFNLVLANPDLAAGFDIPKDWGVMAIVDGKMRVIKRAPKLTPIDQTLAINRIVSFMGWRAYQLASGLTQVGEMAA